MLRAIFRAGEGYQGYGATWGRHGKSGCGTVFYMGEYDKPYSEKRNAEITVYDWVNGKQLGKKHLFPDFKDLYVY